MGSDSNIISVGTGSDALEKEPCLCRSKDSVGDTRKANKVNRNKGFIRWSVLEEGRGIDIEIGAMRTGQDACRCRLN